MNIQIALIRNAKTADSDAYLSVNSDKGITNDAAHELQKLKADGVYPYVDTFYFASHQRCIDTYLAIGKGISGVVSAAFDAQNMGDFAERSKAELDSDPSFIKWAASGSTLECPNGEAWAEVNARVNREFKRICEVSLNDGDGTVGIVAPKMTIFAILQKVLIPRMYYEEIEIGYGRGVLIDLDCDSNAAKIIRKI